MSISNSDRQLFKFIDSIGPLPVQIVGIFLYLFVLVVIVPSLFIRLRDHSIDSIVWLGVLMIFTALTGLTVTIIHLVTNALYRVSLTLIEILILMIVFLSASSGIVFIASEILPIRFSWTPGLITLLTFCGHVFIVRGMIDTVKHRNLKVVLKLISLSLVIIVGVIDVGVCIKFLVK